MAQPQARHGNGSVRPPLSQAVGYVIVVMVGLIIALGILVLAII
jgi:hypothetical protein